MKRVLFHGDKTAQTWHRGYLPVRNLAPLLAPEGIDVEFSSVLNFDYDAYVFHRRPLPSIVPWIHQLKQAGKRIIWECDDDLWHIAKWSPAYASHADTSLVDWMRKIADEVWVSTPTLRDVVGRGRVLPNLIDLHFWPTVVRSSNLFLRVLWAGSAYHDPDVELVASIFEQLLARYTDVMCLFFGSFPESMGEWVRIPGSTTAQLVPHSRYHGRLGYIPPVAIEQYPTTLMNINPDLCLAALVDEPFAHSKSNIKWLEYSMTGAVTVASPLPPYHGHAVTSPDLFKTCCGLVEDEDARRLSGTMYRATVMQSWTWDSERRNLWIEAIRETVA